ncbi:MAG: DUF2170 family protein [Alphaproteobacteria bacterium]|jgi:uncharacterized protein YjfI (DUF2170 family)|tara:strand:- start:659 stop:1255 length:597 start_codon:yes stop_codon:yes gene_type:complete
MVKDPKSAERQQRSREKKRAMGLVSMQVWVPAWGGKSIRELEATLCNTSITSRIKDGQLMSKLTTDDLMGQLSATEEVMNGEIALQKINGETPMIQAVVRDIDEFPIMVSVGNEQILAIADLWGSNEVQEGKAAELNAVLLRANLPVPLSSFSIMGDRYVLFGALSINSDVNTVVEEITTLSNNVLDALDFCQEYLRT